MINSYRDLEVWRRGTALVKRIYEITRDFPKEELYGLVNQMRRCAVSIPSNIAEGKARQHTNEYIQFLYVALGSCAELGTQVTISRDLSFLAKELETDISAEIDEISKMLRGLINRLR